MYMNLISHVPAQRENNIELEFVSYLGKILTPML